MSLRAPEGRDRGTEPGSLGAKERSQPASPLLRQVQRGRHSDHGARTGGHPVSRQVCRELQPPGPRLRPDAVGVPAAGPADAVLALPGHQPHQSLVGPAPATPQPPRPRPQKAGLPPRKRPHSTWPRIPQGADHTRSPSLPRSRAHFHTLCPTAADSLQTLPDSPRVLRNPDPPGSIPGPAVALTPDPLHLQGNILSFVFPSATIPSPSSVGTQR